MVSGVSFGVQWGRTKLHNKQISDAREQYITKMLDTSHFIAGEYYQAGDYETALSEFTGFLDDFPSTLSIETDQKLGREKSDKLNEAIIKVILSLRKLNRNDEILDRVRDFREKFPKSKLAATLDSDQNSALDLYQKGLLLLYDTRQFRLDLAKSFKNLMKTSKTVEVYDLAWHKADEFEESARKTFKDTRKAFKKLLTYELLNEPPYSNLKSEALYFIAKSYLIEGDYRQAYQEFDKIATVEFRNHPDLHDDAMYYAAYCLKQRRIYDEAFGRYTQFMAKFPNSEYVTDAYFDLGEIYKIQKEYDNALTSYKSALQRAKEQSRKVKLQLAEGRNFYKIGNDAKAKGNANDAHAAYEKSIRIYRKLSSEYLEDFFFSEALNFISELPIKPSDWTEEINGEITEYENFVKTHGQDREAKFQSSIGRAFYDQGNDEVDKKNREKAQGPYQKAIENYKVLLAEYPQNSLSRRAKLTIANIFNKLDVYSESIKAYNRIIDDYTGDYGDKTVPIGVEINGYPKKTDPRVFAAYEIGKAYYEMEDYERALEWYLKITGEDGFKHGDTSDVLDFRRDSLAPDALYGAMRTLVKLKRYEELENVAITYIEDLRKDFPPLSAEAQLNFAGVKHIELKQYKNAASEYRKLSEEFGINENGEVSGYLPYPNLRFNLIKLHGKYNEGLCYEECAKQMDNNSDSSAAETYKETTTLFKTTFQPLINDPNIDVEERDVYITEATKIFKKLVIDYPKHEDAAYWQYLAGEFYFTKKDFENAITEYEKVLKIYPTSDYVKDVRDRIKEIHRYLGNKIGEKTGYLDRPKNFGSLGNAQTDKQLDPEDIAKKASYSTVFLGMNTGTGSGFFIAPGLIATNYHVIAGTTKGYAYLISKKLTYAIVGVVATDEERDLAILKVRAFDVLPLPLGNSDNNLEVGETVYAAGSPKGQIDTISDGIISRLRPFEITRLSNGQMLRSKRIQITAPTSPGSSGGPLLNSNGKVIGINHAGLHSPDAQNINVAIPVNYLKELIKRVGTPEPLRNFSITSYDRKQE